MIPLTPDLRANKSLNALTYEYGERLRYNNYTSITSMISVTEFYVLIRSQGRTPYTIPVGGHSVTGLWGYLSAYQELVDQGLWERFSDLVVCSGSGGTSSALAIANYLTGSMIKSVHIVIVIVSCQ